MMEGNNEVPQIKVELSLGLPRKNDENDIKCYKQMKVQYGRQIQAEGANYLIDQFSQKTKQNPELYFNFGFTHADFKAFLMKLMYCRAVRKFIQKKRLERIDEYNAQNQGFQYAFGPIQEE